LRADQDFYSVSVVSRPFDALPQELCVSFPCVAKRTEGKVASSFGMPFDDVAFEFAALLSLFAREPIALLGLRRLANRPTASQYLYIPPPQDIRRLPRPPSPIDSRELRAILDGIGRSTDDDETVDAALAAAKLYYTGLSIARFDPSGAYVSLVSAVECLAGQHYKTQKFDFDQVRKFDNVRPILDELSMLPKAQNLVEQCKNELMKQEHFIKSKFRLLIAEFLPEDFLLTTDKLYQMPAVGAPRDKATLTKSVSYAYDARSQYVHEGKRFPPYIEFGLHQEAPIEMLVAISERLFGTGGKVIPAFIWFERVAHLVIKNYLLRSFAPEIVKEREASMEEKARIQGVVRNLAENIRECLKKLADATSRFLGMAVINPSIPNGVWADDAATVIALRDGDLIGGTADATAEGYSWLKNRVVGEAVGEFFFGSASNPFRDNTLLLPKGWENVLTGGDSTEE
jgi:hypothetical protein